ncbi:hypothetical protein GJ689_16775 [Rhodoplanes serenus]|uniref:Cobalt transporter n=1 Tax=Rhodoplanes serenus TaxID=200615 RepID=A0A9X4XMG5_9BRAD|nr:CbtA family protein [Rhodoplanes serenus]MTW17862.1 hypothetical protein [Rhodoplanes serenus]
MARTLLVRGMLSGILAGLLAFVVAWLIGEPPLELAITFEEHAGHAAGEAPSPEIVSRAVQSTLGLLTGLVVLGGATGGAFGLAFAYAQGRIGRVGPRTTALVLALAGFVVLVLMPQLKYPANPPGAASAETLTTRSWLFVAMMGFSVLTAVAALGLGRRLHARLGAWNAALAGIVAYLVAMVVVMAVLPSVDEVPETFPAAVLWQFRAASLGTQLALWTMLGLVFGALTERSLRARPRGATARPGGAAP